MKISLGPEKSYFFCAESVEEKLDLLDCFFAEAKYGNLSLRVNEVLFLIPSESIETNCVLNISTSSSWRLNISSKHNTIIYYLEANKINDYKIYCIGNNENNCDCIVIENTIKQEILKYEIENISLINITNWVDKYANTLHVDWIGN